MKIPHDLSDLVDNTSLAYDAAEDKMTAEEVLELLKLKVRLMDEDIKYKAPELITVNLLGRYLDSLVSEIRAYNKDLTKGEL